LALWRHLYVQRCATVAHSTGCTTATTQILENQQN